MNIFILDENYDLLGEIEAFSSFIWTRRYYEYGVFELHCAPRYFGMLSAGKYLYRNDRTDLAVIRSVTYKMNEQGRETFCAGALAECLLDLRVIDRPYKANDTPEEISRGLIRKYFCEPVDASRRRSDVLLGESKGIGTRTLKQVTGDPVGIACYEIEKTQEMSHRLKYNFQNNKLTFEVWQGKDRRTSQDENSWAVFSNEFRNVKTSEYSTDDSNYANVAYVAGEGEGDERMVVEVDIRQDPSEERRELYVDARDLQNQIQNEEPVIEGTLDLDPVYQYTDEEYAAILAQRGLEKLAEHALIENMTGTVISTENLEYLVDFDLGDYGTFKNEEIGIELDARITEIIETYENSVMSLDITFGQDSVTSIRKLIRQEAK